MNQTVVRSIEVISSLAISSALGLEGWNLYLHLQDKSLPANLTALSWLAIAALIAHGVEGAIAASKARAYNFNPLLYGIYTFFVGYVGLQKLKDITSS